MVTKYSTDSQNKITYSTLYHLSEFKAVFVQLDCWLR